MASDKEKPFEPEAVMDSIAPMLELTIEEDYRAGIVTHLEAAHRIAQAVLDLKLDDHAEPAPVYLP